MERTEYGATRTKCDCRRCSIFCEFLPGQLAPSDLKRIAKHLNYTSIEQFARENLYASPGAKAMKNGRVFHIRTIVPARQENGHCKFLKDGKCSIHEVSPFGCAFFDSHQPHGAMNKLSGLCLLDVLEDQTTSGPYSQIWQMLNSEGRISPPIAESRNRIDAQMQKEGLE